VNYKPVVFWFLITKAWEEFKFKFDSLICSVLEDDFLLFCTLQVGEIEDVRLVANYKGKSKGYAYVQFKDEVTVY